MKLLIKNKNNEILYEFEYFKIEEDIITNYSVFYINKNDYIDISLLNDESIIIEYNNIINSVKLTGISYDNNEISTLIYFKKE